MKDKIFYKLFEILFNIKVFDFFIDFYLDHMKYWVRKSKGRVVLNRIDNKGVSCRMKGEATVHYSEKLILGDYVHIGDGAFLFARGGISIGKNTQISRNVLIYSSNHNIAGDAIPYDDKYIDNPVVIGESVWIGMNVVITPGVKIGDGAIIGMGTVVSENVPEGAVVVGQKQRIVKYRDMDDFDKKNNEEAWFGKKWPLK